MSQEEKKKSRKQQIKRFLTLLAGFLIFSAYGFYDVYLSIKYLLRLDKSFGAYIYVMTKPERMLMFNEDIGGGYSVWRIIKLYLKSGFWASDDEAAIEIINHEVLHQVLRKVGWRAGHKLDRVHKAFALIDEEEKRWYLKIDFVDLFLPRRDGVTNGRKEKTANGDRKN